MSASRRAEAGRMALAKAVAEIRRWDIAPHGGYSPIIRKAAEDALAFLDEGIREAQAARDLLYVEVLTADAQRADRVQQEAAQGVLDSPG